MEEVLEAYAGYKASDSEEKELEFRARVDRLNFTKALKKLLKSPTEGTREATIDIQPIQKTSDRRLLTRVNFNGFTTDKPTYSYIIKEVKKRYIDKKSNVKLVFAVERSVPRDSVTSPGSKLVRAKLRFSFSLDGWRFDLTVAKGEEVEPARLGVRLTELKSWLSSFYSLGDVDQITNEPRCSFEIEAEHEASSKRDLASSAGSALGRLHDLANSDNELKNELQRMKGLLGLGGEDNIKQIGSKPCVLQRHSYSRIYPPVGWFLTAKADGFRGFLIVDELGARIVSDSPEHSVVRLSEADCGLRLVVDGELLDDQRFICHDLLYRDVSKLEQPFAARLQELQELREALHGVYSRSQVKEFFRIDDLTKAVQQAKSDPGFPTDGHLLIDPGNGYYSTKIYKIKPVNTIDFVAVRKSRGRLNEYWLYCSSNPELETMLKFPVDPNRERLFPEWRPTDRKMPQLFMPPDNPAVCVFVAPHDLGDRQVVELSRDVKAGRWVLHRVRPDRAGLPSYYGNWIVFAMEEWGLMHHPLSLDDLATPGGYFLTARDTVYDAAVKQNSKIKGSLISRVLAESSAPVVLDLGSGRGQDLMRYCAASHVTFVDQDRAALIELVERRYTTRQTGRPARGKSGCAYSFSVMVADLAATAELDRVAAELAVLSPRPYNSVVCNFAIHYLVKDMEAVAGFCKFVKQMLKEGGVFMFTCFSDERVRQLLAEHNGHWRVPLTKPGHSSETRDKYSIKGLGDRCSEIEVLLPFTGGNHYQEHLVDLGALHAVLKSFGFKVESGGFEDFLGERAPADARSLLPLDEADRKFVELYCWTIARLPKTKGGQKRRPRA